jgi:ferric-dicitrate binding protein FerR (iron transport regulator)
MSKKKRKTPEELAEYRRWRARSDENLRRLYELVDRGWAELAERKRVERGPQAS